MSSALKKIDKLYEKVLEGSLWGDDDDDSWLDEDDDWKWTPSVTNSIPIPGYTCLKLSEIDDIIQSQVETLHEKIEIPSLIYFMLRPFFYFRL